MGVLSLWLFWQKWNFISADKIFYKHYTIWEETSANSNIWGIQNCNKKCPVSKNSPPCFSVFLALVCLHFCGPFHSDQPWNEISFIFARNEKQCKQNFFMMQRYFIGPNVTTLLKKPEASSWMFDKYVWPLSGR